MKKRNTFYFSLMFIIGLVISQIFLLQPVFAGSLNKLNTPTLSLARTTGITSDVIIGQVPTGVTINSGASSIVIPNSAKFSFTSDDGSENDYTYRDVFVDRGISCTMPVITTYINTVIPNEGITLTHLLELQNNYGYEVGSHTYNHYRWDDTVTLEEIVYQLTESKRVMTEMGLNISNVFIPYGFYTETLLDQAQIYYRATRTSDSDVNTPLDKRNLKAYWLDEDTSLAQAKTLVATASLNNQYIIFGFHASGASRAFMDDTVGNLIDYIHTFNNTQILTVDKALDRVEGVMKSGVDYSIVDGNIVLNKYFLRSLPLGDNLLTLGFSDGTSETMTITIEKTITLRHNIALTSTSLSSGANVLGKDTAITFTATLDTNMVGTKTSTATIGSTTVNGVLVGNVYTYTFNTNNITDGTYNKVTITSNVGANQKSIDSAIQLQVQKKTLSNIIITHPANKLTYVEEENLDLTGLIITANYSDNTSTPISDYTVSGYTATPGVKTINISYLGKTVTFNVTVNTAPNPIAPTVVGAVATDYDSINITWNAVPGVTGYIVSRSLSAAGVYTQVGNVTVLNFADNNLYTGTAYYYKVSAYRTINGILRYSTPSAAVHATPIIKAPTSYTVSKINARSVRLRWHSVAGATGYEIYSAPTLYGSYAKLSSVTLTTYVDSNYRISKKYYKVRAYRIVQGVRIYSAFTVAKTGR